MARSSGQKKSPGEHRTKCTLIKNREEKILYSFDLSIPQQKALYDKYNTKLCRFLLQDQSRVQAVPQFVFTHNYWYNQDTGKTQVGNQITNKEPFNIFLIEHRDQYKDLTDAQYINKLNQERRLMHQLDHCGQDIFESIETYVKSDRFKGPERKAEVRDSLKKFVLNLFRQSEAQTQLVLPNYFPLGEMNNKPSKFQKKMYEFKQQMSTSGSVSNISDNSNDFFQFSNDFNTSLEYQLPNFGLNMVCQKFCIAGNNKEEEDLFMQDQNQDQKPIKSSKDPFFNLDVPDLCFGPKFPQVTQQLSKLWEPKTEKEQQLFKMDIQPEQKVNQTQLNKTNFNNLSNDDSNNINSIDELSQALDSVMYWQKDF